MFDIRITEEMTSLDKELIHILNSLEKMYQSDQISKCYHEAYRERTNFLRCNEEEDYDPYKAGLYRGLFIGYIEYQSLVHKIMQLEITLLDHLTNF